MYAGVGGIDEAGRGALIGPLIIAGVSVESDKLEMLKAAGVRDSKQLSPRRREALISLIQKESLKVEISEISPEEIDLRFKRNANLNTIELRKMAQIAQRLGCNVVYVDAVDVDEQRFARDLSGLAPEIMFVAEHRADEKYVVTSAASIVAKVTRDRKIREIESRFGALGSGYPGDERTISFVRNYYIENGCLPPFVRKTWKTVLRTVNFNDARKMGEDIRDPK